LRLNRLSAGVTKAVLPTVPALEYGVTAQAGGKPGIRGGLGFLPSTSWGLATHSYPQRCKVDSEGPYSGPNTLSTTTAED
jgi:hypothetical protein